MTENPPPDNSLQACPKCKSPVIHGTKFCESCGAKIELPPVCRYCGAPNEHGTKFCESCGLPRQEVPREKQPAVPDEFVPLPLLQPDEIIAPVGGAPDHTGIPLPPEQALPESPTPSSFEDVADKSDEKTIAEMQPVAAPVAATIEEPKKPRQDQPPSPVSGPAKPLPATTLAIIGVVVLIVLALVAYGVGLPLHTGAGSAQKSGGAAPGSPPPVTSSDSSMQVNIPVTGTLTPGQTQVPPANLAVTFQAERDAITGIVTVTFSGGQGQNGVKDVLFRLTRSDGQVLQKTFTLTQIGKSESLQGTKMTDRVEVIANYYNGNQYKILDQTFEYKKR